ncbi:hypothetical protein Tco_0430840 [Tanacetum coccineum]
MLTSCCCLERIKDICPNQFNLGFWLRHKGATRFGILNLCLNSRLLGNLDLDFQLELWDNSLLVQGVSQITASRGETGRLVSDVHAREERSRSPKRHHDRKAYSRKGGRMSESEDSAGGHWKSKSKKQRSSMEDDDLS